MSCTITKRNYLAFTLETFGSTCHPTITITICLYKVASFCGYRALSDEDDIFPLLTLKQFLEASLDVFLLSVWVLTSLICGNESPLVTRECFREFGGYWWSKLLDPPKVCNLVCVIPSIWVVCAIFLGLDDGFLKKLKSVFRNRLPTKQ